MLKHKTILVASHKRPERDILRRELEAEGFHVKTVSDGEDLILTAHKHDRPDLVVMETDLPFLDGATVLRTLAERRPPIPAVVRYQGSLPESVKVMGIVAAVREDDMEGLKRVVGKIMAQGSGAKEP
jgi:CheY-like chemotaxis protein